MFGQKKETVSVVFPAVGIDNNQHEPWAERKGEKRLKPLTAPPLGAWDLSAAVPKMVMDKNQCSIGSIIGKME